MQRLLNHMRLQASLAQGGRATVRIGTVSSYRPENYSCKVMVQPENVETGWLPITSPWVGNGWGMFAPPTIGDMVDVHFQEESIEAGFVSQRFYNDSDRPLTVQPGEFWLVHKSGSFVKLLNNGEIHIGGAGDMKKLVTDAFMALFNAHTHGGSPVPDQQMAASHLTTILKAN